jgi:hypothetical protein
MKLKARQLHAQFSGMRGSWTVELDDIVFQVRYIKIDDAQVHRLGATVAELWVKSVEIDWRNDVLRLSNWSEIEKRVHHYATALYNPDDPRNKHEILLVG